MRSRMGSMGCDVRQCFDMRRLLLGIGLRRRTRCLGACGQGTVEYALVTAAFLAIVLCLGVLWRFASEGGFASGVVDSLAHRLARGMADVVLF